VALVPEIDQREALTGKMGPRRASTVPVCEPRGRLDPMNVETAAGPHLTVDPPTETSLRSGRSLANRLGVINRARQTSYGAGGRSASTPLARRRSLGPGRSATQPEPWHRYTPTRHARHVIRSTHSTRATGTRTAPATMPLPPPPGSPHDAADSGREPGCTTRNEPRPGEPPVA
jgi:hypothetical protein